jgi:hypothetical protein
MPESVVQIRPKRTPQHRKASQTYRKLKSVVFFQTGFHFLTQSSTLRYLRVILLLIIGEPLIIELQDTGLPPGTGHLCHSFEYNNFTSEVNLHTQTFFKIMALCWFLIVVIGTVPSGMVCVDSCLCCNFARAKNKFLTMSHLCGGFCYPQCSRDHENDDQQREPTG